MRLLSEWPGENAAPATLRGRLRGLTGQGELRTGRAHSLARHSLPRPPLTSCARIHHNRGRSLGEAEILRAGELSG